MERLAIIQLSDLQFGKKHIFGSPSNISTKLYCDITNMAEKFCFTPIYLLLSGDITETAHTDEFDDATKQINILREQLSIDHTSVIIVPGNHDINWELSKISETVGDKNLKYVPFNKFYENTTNKKPELEKDYYQVVCDERHAIDFILVNSCELESHSNHIGYVDASKLLKSFQFLKNQHTKVVVLHHRIDYSIPDVRTLISNAQEIETLLLNNGINIVLTGHVHQSISNKMLKDGNSIIYSGTGSAGVNKDQREDGIQNQYSILVFDKKQKQLEIYHRAFNPSSKTKYGLGGWTEDNGCSTNPEFLDAPFLSYTETAKESLVFDSVLMLKYGIRSNPFTYNNAEKISSDLIFNLFVSSENRHRAAIRLNGDAIIRGPRGSGKTMLLRYLFIIANNEFDKAIQSKFIAQSFPVFVNLSRIHRTDWDKSIDYVSDSADKLIFDSVIDALELKGRELQIASFKSAIHNLKQRLNNLKNREGTLISKLGDAIRLSMSSFFSHVLLLIDEIAPVFPKEFFIKKEIGFLKWMNDIRNSGPFFTRVAVYPNDLSDSLNEDRYGTIVNLNYDIRKDEDYLAFRQYIYEVVNKYLCSVSLDKDKPLYFQDILDIFEDDSNDALEQLIYASDGSSRRFLSLMDKCLYFKTDVVKMNKEHVIKVIKDFSSNLLSSYDYSSQELAQSIAKACKGQATFKFKLPNLSTAIYPLYSAREELNIIKISELGTGKRATTYEFTYPYCILMDIHTHNIKDSRKICQSRDRVTGRWISTVTTIKREDLDYFQSSNREIGEIIEIEGDILTIKGSNGSLYLSDENAANFKIGDEVSFIPTDTLACDLSIIETYFDFRFIGGVNIY